MAYDGRFRYVLFALLIALVCIETAQQVLIVGAFDVDDIILDFIGAGFGILAQIAAACFIKKRMRE